jgi:hypothetical protein
MVSSDVHVAGFADPEAYAFEKPSNFRPALTSEVLAARPIRHSARY